MMMIDAIDNDSGGNYRLTHHLSGHTTAGAVFPVNSSGFCYSDLLKSESEFTYSLPVSRKRSRDFDSMNTLYDDGNVNWSPMDRCATFTFLGDEVSYQIRRQQFEIDRFVARQTEKVRTKIGEKRRRNSMKLVTALEEGITQRLKAKEDEITNMTKLNSALEDKVKSLHIENQIWRELAQSNEATANALRNNLNQVLEQVVNGGFRHRNKAAGDGDAAVALPDDDQSCCGSNDGDERMLAEQDSSNSNMNNRLCRSCGDAESCVLLLPCRHLCLCTVCVSSVDICPVCKSAKNISVHVYMS